MEFKVDQSSSGSWVSQVRDGRLKEIEGHDGRDTDSQEGLGEKGKGRVWKMYKRLIRQDMVIVDKAFQCQHKEEVNMSKDSV